MGMKTVDPTWYAVVIHGYIAGEMCRSRCIEGPAVATIVWSKAASNIPSSVPTKVKIFCCLVSEGGACMELLMVRLALEERHRSVDLFDEHHSRHAVGEGHLAQ